MFEIREHLLVCRYLRRILSLTVFYRVCEQITQYRVFSRRITYKIFLYFYLLLSNGISILFGGPDCEVRMMNPCP